MHGSKQEPSKILVLIGLTYLAGHARTSSRGSRAATGFCAKSPRSERGRDVLIWTGQGPTIRETDLFIFVKNRKEVKSNTMKIVENTN